MIGRFIKDRLYKCIGTECISFRRSAAKINFKLDQGRDGGFDFIQKLSKQVKVDGWTGVNLCKWPSRLALDCPFWEAVHFSLFTFLYSDHSLSTTWTRHFQPDYDSTSDLTKVTRVETPVQSRTPVHQTAVHIRLISIWSPIYLKSHIKSFIFSMLTSSFTIK